MCRAGPLYHSTKKTTISAFYIIGAYPDLRLKLFVFPTANYIFSLCLLLNSPLIVYSRSAAYAHVKGSLIPSARATVSSPLTKNCPLYN